MQATLDALLWQVGTDANAQLLKDSLQKCGVDLRYLREIEGPSGTAMIMVDPSGHLASIQHNHVVCACLCGQGLCSRKSVQLVTNCDDLRMLCILHMFQQENPCMLCCLHSLSLHAQTWLLLNNKSCVAGENIIMIVGGANQSEWEFSEDDRKVLKLADM